MLDLEQLKPQYITDVSGKKTAVIVSMEASQALLEDIDDLAAVAERREEPTLSHEQLIADLKQHGFLQS